MLKRISRDKKKLHWVAAHKSADWDNLEYSQLNVWQKIAQRTHGLISPGNSISLIGLCLVISGTISYSNGDVTSGILQVGAGRISDYFDGIAANMTATKSSTGAIMDVSVDTFEFLFVLFVLVLLNTIPWLLLIIILVPKFCGAVGYTIARTRGKFINSTGEAKIAAAIMSLGLLCFMASTAESTTLSRVFSTAGWGLLLSATALSLSSVILYVKVGFTSYEQPKL